MDGLETAERVRLAVLLASLRRLRGHGDAAPDEAARAPDEAGRLAAAFPLRASRSAWGRPRSATSPRPLKAGVSPTARSRPPLASSHVPMSTISRFASVRTKPGYKAVVATPCFFSWRAMSPARRSTCVEINRWNAPSGENFTPL